MSLRNAEEILSLLDHIFGGRRDYFARYSDGKGVRSCEKCFKETYGRKCIGCKGGKYITLKAQNLINHIKGKEAVGIFPVKDGLCRFSVIELKGEDCAVKLKCLSDACNELGICCLREVTDFGKGARLWLLFGIDLRVRQSAELTLSVITKAAQKDIYVFDGAKDIIPVPMKSGEESVLLPLYNLAKGASFFLDENMKPIRYPVEYLENLDTKLDLKEQDLKKDDVIKGELCGKVYISLKDIGADTTAALCRQAMLFNPDYKGEGSPIIRCWEICGGKISFPRNINLNSAANKVIIENNCVKGTALGMKAKVNLNPWQENARVELLKNGGVITAPVGSGKTEVICSAISDAGKNALILVPDRSTALLWRKRIAKIFDVKESSIGLIINDSDFPNGRIDVAVIHENTQLRLAEYISFYGTAVVADCDRILCKTEVLCEIMDSICASHVFGLSAKDIDDAALGSFVRLYIGRQIK